MKSFMTTPILAALAAGLIFLQVGCAESGDGQAVAEPAAAASVPEGMLRGTVLETMNSGGYTYVFVETDADRRWVATREMAVKVGDVVQMAAGMPMTDFESKTLKRTFEVVYFVDRVENLSAS